MMECPKCNDVMIHGFIQSANGIFWSEKKHKIYFAANERKGEIVVTDTLTDYCTEAYYCSRCGTIVIPNKVE
ncbi:PF20097 family protein [Aminipila terrae]|uniref:DUF6487 domain-containing protein n=1 Tax=Aminipila terrae TaxID=2697030 RepID=A0A6P1MFY2_9FIRM|nr:PF20097 family protein [Aminipila terrae]QHI73619.1 hypothetical protein Ami3637_15670 [Aminipila terrae]